MRIHLSLSTSTYSFIHICVCHRYHGIWEKNNATQKCAQPFISHQILKGSHASAQLHVEQQSSFFEQTM